VTKKKVATIAMKGMMAGMMAKRGTLRSRLLRTAVKAGKAARPKERMAKARNPNQILKLSQKSSRNLK